MPAVTIIVENATERLVLGGRILNLVAFEGSHVALLWEGDIERVGTHEWASAEDGCRKCLLEQHSGVGREKMHDVHVR